MGLPRPSVASRFYHPELDGLRFFAFFGVFVHHTLSAETTYYSARHVPFGALIASFVSAGRFGVDLFFLLSAYLLTALLLREKEQFGQVDLRSFYMRRILRIWPLYFLAILIGALLPLVDPTQDFPLKYALAFVLMSGNWVTSLIVVPNSVMVILWSVSFEEQFYLVWPAVISRVRRDRALLYASGLLLVVSAVARLVLLQYGRHSFTATFTNTFARFDPLALGIITAVLLRNRRIHLGWLVRSGFLVAGCATLLIAGHYFSMTRIFMLAGYPAMAIGACLVFLSVFQCGVAPGWLRYLGKISYGLYVFHMLAAYLVAKAFGGTIHDLRHFVPYWFLSLGLTLAVAALSYRFLESPFLRLKERFAYVKSRPV